MYVYIHMYMYICIYGISQLATLTPFRVTTSQEASRGLPRNGQARVRQADPGGRLQGGGGRAGRARGGNQPEEERGKKHGRRGRVQWEVLGWIVVDPQPKLDCILMLGDDHLSINRDYINGWWFGTMEFYDFPFSWR